MIIQTRDWQLHKEYQGDKESNVINKMPMIGTEEKREREFNKVKGSGIKSSNHTIMYNS